MSDSEEAGGEAGSVFTAPKAELQAHVERTREHFEQARAELAGLVQLSAERRRTSKGRLKDGEIPALRAIIAVAAAFPDAFRYLGAMDEGEDPNAFEAELVEDRLDRLEMLASLSGALEALQTQLADTVLRLGELAKPVALRAYEVAKPLAAANEQAATLLAPAVDFYAWALSRNDPPLLTRTDPPLTLAPIPG